MKEGLQHIVSVPGSGTGPWPLLVFLHGYDEGAPTELRTGVTRHGPLRPGSAPRATEEFIVLAPQLPYCGDYWARHADDVLRLVRDVPHADPSRLYLTGFSFGGNGVFDLALAQPDVWAAAWAVDPTRVPPRPLPVPLWLSIGGIARRGREHLIRALGVTNDPASDRVWHDDGADHVGSATLAYRDERIYEWLLARRRRGDDVR